MSNINGIGTEIKTHCVVTVNIVFLLLSSENILDPLVNTYDETSIFI